MSAAKKKRGSNVLASVEPIGADELDLLRRAPYDVPLLVRTTHEVKLAQKLVEAGLLARNPTATALVVRCTERGEEVARPLSLTRARLAVQEVRVAVDEGDPEKAASLEQQLHVRVLTEVANPDRLTLGVYKGLARIALTTTAINFRRTT